MPAPFDQFSRDMMNHFLPGQQAMQDIATGASGSNQEAVSAAGALSPSVEVTELSVDGTKAYTLADGPLGIPGRIKSIQCVAATNTPLGTLTIASPDNTAGFVCAATFCFTAVGQRLVLRWTGTKWRCIQKIRTGVNVLVIGTTATTGIANMTNIDVSVTGTVASTAANALPNGSAVGEQVSITCSTATGTPHGDLGGVYQVKAGGATGTLLDDFTLVTDNALLMWTGVAWKPLVLAGTTLSIA